MTSSNRSIRRRAALLAAGAALLGAGCALPPAGPAQDHDAMALAIIQRSFTPQGQATLDRIAQDALQKACSAETAPSEALARRLEAVEMATIRQPASGRYTGDWREGERLAQNGRGMTWTDPAGSPAGGNCYNCHQIGKAEISYGTVGPSLYNYGKLRGVADPEGEASRPIVRYTWGKLYNAKAYNACSTMPRFGAAHVLTEKQMQDLMALLLDPKSPVNQ